MFQTKQNLSNLDKNKLVLEFDIIENTIEGKDKDDFRKV